MAIDGSVLGVTFAHRQLNGIYDSGRFREFLGRLGNRDETRALVAEYEGMGEAPVEYDPMSATHAFYADAFLGAMEHCGFLLSNPIDTAAPGTWLRLRDMLVCCARLVTCPGFSYDGMSTDDAITSCAVVLDMVSRVACERTRHLAPLRSGSEDEIRRRGWSIRADIVCGRVGAWIGYVDDMGCMVSINASKVIWQELVEEFSRARERVCLERIMAARGIGADLAMRVMCLQVSAIASVFDAHQQHCFVRSCEGVDLVSVLGDARVVFDERLFPKVAPYLVIDPERDDSLAGYCAVFGLSAVSSVVHLDGRLSRSLRRQYDLSVASLRETAQVQG